MEIKYENKWTFILAIFAFGSSTYVLSGKLIIVSIVIIIICIIYIISRRRKIKFADDNIIVNNNLRLKKNFVALYSQIIDVHFDQVYVTSYVNIVVTITFNLNTNQRKAQFDIDKHYNAGRLYRLLNEKDIKCRFSDDYIETLIVRASNY